MDGLVGITAGAWHCLLYTVYYDDQDVDISCAVWISAFGFSPPRPPPPRMRFFPEIGRVSFPLDYESLSSDDSDEM